MLKIFGYKKNADELLELKEASLLCSVNDLDELINFLQFVKIEHGKISKKEMCESHYRDWSKNWDKDSSDFIVVTQN